MQFVASFESTARDCRNKNENNTQKKQCHCESWMWLKITFEKLTLFWRLCPLMCLASSLISVCLSILLWYCSEKYIDLIEHTKMPHKNIPINARKSTSISSSIQSQLNQTIFPWWEQTFSGHWWHINSKPKSIKIRRFFFLHSRKNCVIRCRRRQTQETCSTQLPIVEKKYKPIPKCFVLTRISSQLFISLRSEIAFNCRTATAFCVLSDICW